MKKGTVESQTLTEVAYNFLREKIIKNEYPAGTPIQEGLVTRELDISRTPIREALHRLERDGFVNIYPRKGAFVNHVPVRKILEIMEIRIIIEPKITMLAINKNNIKDEDLASIKQKLIKIRDAKKFETGKARAIGREVHNCIFDAFENETLSNFRKSLDTDVERGCSLASMDEGTARNLLDQHLQIIEFLKKQEGAAAGKLMEEHLIYARDNFLMYRIPV